VPHGVFEKLASGMRFHRRAARTDLQRFKAHATTEYAKHEHGKNDNKTASSGRRKQPQRA